jgi:uncharacterized membrane protein YdbT with pleckstrin-like domain
MRRPSAVERDEEDALALLAVTAAQECGTVAVMDEPERTLWTGRPSWRGRMSIFIPGLLLAVAVVVGARLADVSWQWALLAGLVVALATVVYGLIQTILWKYTITSRRVIVRHGLISVNEQTARLERVQDLTLHQSLFDRIFGVGKLTIDTAGSEGGALDFIALEDPAGVRELLENAVRSEVREPV